MPSPSRRFQGKRPPGAGRGPRLGPPPPGLFHDILLAPDRESIPEARPMVSVHAQDEADFAHEVERRALRRYPLRRRGEEHGTLCELRPEGLLGPRPRRRRRETIESERWYGARPILLPGLAEDVAKRLDERQMEDLHRRLSNPAGLLQHVERRLLGSHDGAPAFRIADPAANLFDPERDLARVILADPSGRDDLWLKTGRLSTFAGDASLRLRASFGVEGDDDASEDHGGHRQVARLAQCMLPGAEPMARLEELWAKLERHVGRPVFGTQHIGYWNAPNGGAALHHDAFGATDQAAGEDPADPRRGQRGVAYAQLTGHTVWLALSIEELRGRVAEFVRWMQEGDAPDLREALGSAWDEVLEISARRSPCLAELAQPSGGRLGRVVQAPEFTGYLADAGHSLVLHPGDMLVLPNHGPERTAMHAVFCASERPGYALSMALRAG